jgi:hypothetical protein
VGKSNLDYVAGFNVMTRVLRHGRMRQNFRFKEGLKMEEGDMNQRMQVLSRHWKRK